MLDNFDLIVIEVGLLAFAGIIAFIVKSMFSSIKELEKRCYSELIDREEFKTLRQHLLEHIDAKMENKAFLDKKEKI